MHGHGTQIRMNGIHFLTFSNKSRNLLSHRDIHGQQPISHVCETERVNVLTNEFKLASDWPEVERWGGRAPRRWGCGVTGGTVWSHWVDVVRVTGGCS